MQRKEALFLFLLVVLKLAYQGFLYLNGFVSLSADEFSRGIRALNLSMDWHGGATLYTGAWMPLELYLNAAALWLWPDPLLAPRLTVFACSVLLLVFFYKLVRRLFGQPLIAAAAAVLVATHPWYIWLSGTPMLDMYYMSFFIIGLYFVFEWRLDGKRGHLRAGLCFFIAATGFHTQAWILVNLTCLLLLAEAVFDSARRSRVRIGQVALFGALANSFAASYLVLEYAVTGVALNFFSLHSEYSKLFYHGYRESAVSKLLYYPRLVLSWLRLVAPLAALSVFPLARFRDRLPKSFMLILGAAALFTYGIFNVCSVPATAAAARYVFPFLVFFAPYAALCLWALAGLAAERWGNSAKAFVFAVLLLPICIPNVVMSYHKPKGGMPADAIRAGRRINALYEEARVPADGKVLIELVYWQYKAVQLLSKRGGAVLYDRPRNNRERDFPSDLDALDDAQIEGYLTRRHVAVVAVRSSALKQRLSDLDFLTSPADEGHWRIFQVDPGNRLRGPTPSPPMPQTAHRQTNQINQTNQTGIPQNGLRTDPRSGPGGHREHP